MGLSSRHRKARSKLARMTRAQVENACKSSDFVLAAEAQKLRNSWFNSIFNRK